MASWGSVRREKRGGEVQPLSHYTWQPCITRVYFKIHATPSSAASAHRSRPARLEHPDARGNVSRPLARRPVAVHTPIASNRLEPMSPHTQPNPTALFVTWKGKASRDSRRQIEFAMGMAAPRAPLPLPQLLLLLVAALLAAAPLPRAAGADVFDVRRHLSTVTRCAAGDPAPADLNLFSAVGS